MKPSTGATSTPPSPGPHRTSRSTTRWSGLTPESTVGGRLRARRWRASDLQVEPREFIEAGDEIIVIFHARGRGKSSGIPLDVELAHVFTMQDGHLQVMRAYTSKASALEAVGLSVQDAHADF
jgi:ketosteroid isomerase-like protein